MDFHQELALLGVNIEEALGRFRGNSAILDKMIAKYPKATEDCDVKGAFEKKDLEEALKSAHTLKGITGNLSLTPLYDGYSEVVRLLRADKPDEAEKTYNDLLPVQEKIIDCISRNCG